MRNFFLILFFVSSLYLLSQETKPAIKATFIAKGLMAPVAMDCPHDNSKRLFICEQTGKIRIIKNGKILKQPFIDVGDKLDEMGKIYSEKGLLGIAFHPDYKTNGRFFIYYTAPKSSKESDHKNVVAEFKVSSDADIAEPASHKIILEVDQPQSNHCGGQLAFGPDGYLYIALGDGGGAGDKHGNIGNGQNLETLLGKILRIDINSKSPYAVPSDNPFVNKKNIINGQTNPLPEIYAYGLRNPWRFSFDKKTGKLFCADVGQNKWEEIDIILKGKNYGWRMMEGNHCYEPAEACDQKGLELPIAEYDHDKGISVTGGFVYNGKKMPGLEGLYIFGDWKGSMFYLKEKEGKWELNDLDIEGKKNNDLDLNINSFGEDENGELYILTQKFTGTFNSNGIIYLIEKK